MPQKTYSHEQFQRVSSWKVAPSITQVGDGALPLVCLWQQVDLKGNTCTNNIKLRHHLCTNL